MTTRTVITQDGPVDVDLDAEIAEWDASVRAKSRADQRCPCRWCRKADVRHARQVRRRNRPWRKLHGTSPVRPASTRGVGHPVLGPRR